ncbi:MULTISPECIES: hypothetical protein [unclassified Streptomyces]|uniref:hypothetical protein n=1 Tax=unclassified Streptomyces TaxID=2593676 RepID=UPI000B09CFC9|nr:hypothetical protein [Streptomyces sp. TSRI0281]
MAQRAHRKPGRRVARVLAVPAKGEKGRRAALLGYGGLAFSLATGTTFHAVATERSPATVAVLTGDIYTDDPAKAERTTVFDGAGGVAGVPFTDEQRKAIVKESMRRGLSEADAYALAYGDDAKVQIHEDGTVTVDTREVVLANGPVYRKAKEATSADEKGIETQSAGTEAEPVTKPDAERKASQGNRGQKEAGKAKGTATTPKSPTQESPVADGGSRPREGQAGAAVASEGPYYPDSGENPYDKGLGEAMKDALNRSTGLWTASPWGKELPKGLNSHRTAN